MTHVGARILFIAPRSVRWWVRRAGLFVWLPYAPAVGQPVVFAAAIEFRKFRTVIVVVRK